MSLWWWLLIAVVILLNAVVMPPALVRLSRWMSKKRWWQRVEKFQGRVAGEDKR